MNELSPEFLSHASDIAYEKNRDRQSDIFKKGSKDAWRRDYSLEDIPGADLTNGKEPCHYDFKMHGATRPILTSHRGDSVIRQYDNDADISHAANDRLKPGHRRKILQGLKSAEHMRSGLDKDGNPYR